MNSGVSEGWETPGQNSNPTVPVVKHCLSQVYLLIKNIGQTFPSASEDLPVVAIENEVPRVKFLSLLLLFPLAFPLLQDVAGVCTVTLSGFMSWRAS